jgi:rod shape-determining protein MreC
VFVFLSIILIGLDSRYAYVGKVRASLLYFTSPIQYVVNWPIQTYHRVTQSVASYRALLDENIQLRYQQVLLQGKVQRLMTLQKENAQLRKLLEYKALNNESPFILAELLSVKTDPYRQLVVLDRGINNNVEIGQAVFDARGVMGQIIEVGPLTSTVMLITDTNSSVPVKNLRSGERAILSGTHRLPGLSLNHLPRTSSVKVGDELVTSGLGKRFPEGYPVGVVNGVYQDGDEAFITVDVKPKANIGKSRLMLITAHSDKDKKLMAELSSLEIKHKGKHR